MAEIRHEKKDGREVLTVSGDLTVKHAKAVKEAFLEAVQNASAVEISVERIDDLDISFAQLVCSAHRTAADLNKQLTITGYEQERFSQMLGRFGFFRNIGCNESTGKTCLWLCDRETP